VAVVVARGSGDFPGRRALALEPAASAHQGTLTGQRADACLCSQRDGQHGMRVGYGSHFFQPATWAMALNWKISLEEFRAALVAGKVKELPKGQHP